MQVSDILNFIDSGDTVSAEQAFNAVMTDKVNVALDLLKVDSSQAHFGLNNTTTNNKE